MNILGFIDKIDDMTLEVVQTIRGCIEKPVDYCISKAEHNQERKDKEFEYEQERKDKEFEYELEMRRKRDEEELNQMVIENDFRRSKEVLDAAKQYQIELYQTLTESIEVIGTMSIELRKKADDMVYEKTQQYEEMKNSIKSNVTRQIKEIDEEFAENEMIRTRMQEVLIDDMTEMLKSCNTFVNDLREDLKQLRGTIDALIGEGKKTINAQIGDICSIGETSKKLLGENK